MTRLPLVLLLLVACGDGAFNDGAFKEGYGDTGSADSQSFGGGSDADTDTDTDADADENATYGDSGDVADSADDSSSDSPAGPTCDAETPVVLFLSPDDSNSMSSPSQARIAILESWSNLSRVPIRTYEFMNYYQFDYEAPPSGSLAVEPSMALKDDGTWALQVGLTSASLSNEDRSPINITLSFDTSGSMSGLPLELVKESGLAIASSLRAGDVISVAGWADGDYTLLSGRAVSGPDDPAVVAAIEGLSSGGSTNFSGGLAAAYDLALDNHDPERINRVVLLSDGGANVGVTDADLIGAYAADNDRDGIYLVGVGVGSATSYNDTLMDTATDLGRGASVFIGDAAEAWRVFGEDAFVRTMDVAWRNVHVELDLPPGFEIVRFSGEEYSTDPREIEPQHLAPDDSMVFYLTLDTCAPENVSDASEIGVVATYTNPVTGVEQTTTVTRTFAELTAADNHLLDKGAAVYAYASGLVAWKEAATEDEKQQAITMATERVQAAQLTNPGDEDLEEIATVLDELR